MRWKDSRISGAELQASLNLFLLRRSSACHSRQPRTPNLESLYTPGAGPNATSKTQGFGQEWKNNARASDVLRRSSPSASPLGLEMHKKTDPAKPETWKATEKRVYTYIYIYNFACSEIPRHGRNKRSFEQILHVGAIWGKATSPDIGEHTQHSMRCLGRALW